MEIEPNESFCSDPMSEVDRLSPTWIARGVCRG
jgi:hypothetical protein